MATIWSVHAYRRICRVDIDDRKTQRFDYCQGDEASMRGLFAEFKDNPQILAAELRDPFGTVVDRYDRLLDLWPNLHAGLLEAVVEPRLR